MTLPSSPVQTRLGPGPVDRAGCRPGLVGFVLGSTQLALTTTYLVALWGVARREDRIDPDSWSLVGAYVMTVFAVPLLLLGVVGTALCLHRSREVAVGGTIVAAVASVGTTAACLYLGWINLSQDPADPEGQTTAWALLYLALVVVAAVPWIAAVIAHPVTRPRPRADGTTSG